MHLSKMQLDTQVGRPTGYGTSSHQSCRRALLGFSAFNQQVLSLSTLCFVFEGISRLEFSEVSQNHLTFDEQGQWSRCVMFGKKDC